MSNSKPGTSLKWIQSLLLIIFVFGLLWVFIRINSSDTFVTKSKGTSAFISNNYDYSLSDSAHIIDFGVQPLWVPAVIITQVMQHDMLLKEMLAEINMEIRFWPFFDGNDMFGKMGSHQLEGGVAGDMSVLLGIVKQGIEVVSPVQDGFNSIVSSKYLMVNDLKDRKIAFTYGTSAHYGLLSSLSAYGIESNETNLVPMNIYQMIEALRNNEIDAFSAWEPIPSMAMHNYRDQVSIHRMHTMGFLFFDQKFAQLNPEAVNLIVAAEIRAFNWLQMSRNNLLKGVEWGLKQSELFLNTGEMQLTNYQVATLAKKDILSYLDLPTFNKELFEQSGAIAQEFHFLQKHSFISDSIKWYSVRAHFNSKVLSEIQKQPEYYRLNDFNYNPNME